MLISAIRTVIIYLLVILSIRIMGKRQISELRPSELVVALLISDLAAVPMQDTGTPLLYGVLPIFLLVALELLLSGIMLKFPAMERLVSGNPVTVIRHGALDVKALGKLRISVDDLMEALRMQNVFELSEVDYALAETNGHITVYPRPEARPVTCGDLQISEEDAGMPALVISDSTFCPWGLELCGQDEQTVHGILEQQSLSADRVFLMTLSAGGRFFILTDRGERLSGEVRL